MRKAHPQKNGTKYFLTLDYKNGTAQIDTQTSVTGGREYKKRLLPEALKDIFTSEFVRRFVFDGEQAEKSMDRFLGE